MMLHDRQLPNFAFPRANAITRVESLCLVPNSSLGTIPAPKPRQGAFADELGWFSGLADTILKSHSGSTRASRVGLGALAETTFAASVHLTPARESFRSCNIFNESRGVSPASRQNGLLCFGRFTSRDSNIGMATYSQSCEFLSNSDECC